MKKYFEYVLTPKSSSTDVYKEGMTIISLIIDESHSGIHYSKVNRYEVNVGTRKIEISLLNSRIPKKIMNKLSKSWSIESPYIIEQISFKK